MVGFSANAGSLRLTIGALGSVANPRVVASAALQAAAAELFREVKASLSLTDHSLGDLADLDHPYARRHGQIQTQALGHDGWRVHTSPSNPSNPPNQTGALVRQGLKMEMSQDQVSWRVRLDDVAVPEARWVVYGTRKMLPRDPLWVTAMDPRVQKLMMTAVVRTLGKQLRTKGFIRFGKGAPGPSPLSAG